MSANDDLKDRIFSLLTSAAIPEAGDDTTSILHEIAAQPEPQRSTRALELATERATGVPLAYVLGKVAFRGLELIAEPGVIVPRPVSELAVEAAERALRPLAASRGAEGIRIIDMCSGSGNLACALGMAFPTARIWSCDLMPECSALARRNIAKHDLGARIQVVTGDLFAPLSEASLTGTVDAIVSSPPFISTGRLGKDRAHLLEHEPREAFDAGPYGLSIHQRIVKEGVPMLRPGGWMVLEVGLGQTKQVQILFQRARAYEAIDAVNDAAGVPFVVQAKRGLSS